MGRGGKEREGGWVAGMEGGRITVLSPQSLPWVVTVILKSQEGGR